MSTHLSNPNLSKAFALLHSTTQLPDSPFEPRSPLRPEMPGIPGKP